MNEIVRFFTAQVKWGEQDNKYAQWEGKGTFRRGDWNKIAVAIISSPKGMTGT